jgi:hypothetical protein
MPLQTSVLKATKRTTGDSLSLINDTKVNDLPSGRHGSQIHLLPKRQQTSAAKVNDSTQNQLNQSSTSERKPLAIVARGSVKS